MPSVKATKTHEAPSTCKGDELRRGDLMFMYWHTQEEPLWCRFLGYARFAAPDAATHVTVLPPAKDERGAVTFAEPGEVVVMRRRPDPPEQQTLETEAS